METACGWPSPRGATGYEMAFQLRGFLALRHRRELVVRIDQVSTGEVEGLCPRCGAYVLVELGEDAEVRSACFAS